MLDPQGSGCWVQRQRPKLPSKERTHLNALLREPCCPVPPSSTQVSVRPTHDVLLDHRHSVPKTTGSHVHLKQRCRPWWGRRGGGAAQGVKGVGLRAVRGGGAGLGCVKDSPRRGVRGVGRAGHTTRPGHVVRGACLGNDRTLALCFTSPTAAQVMWQSPSLNARSRPAGCTPAGPHAMLAMPS